MVGTDPLGVQVVTVSSFVNDVFSNLRITTGRLSLDQFRQAVVAEPRLIVWQPHVPIFFAVLLMLHTTGMPYDRGSGGRGENTHP